MVKLLEEKDVNSSTIQRVNELLAQLTQRNPQDLHEVVSRPNVFLAVYVENGLILGMASLSLYQNLSAHKGWIEDVVVDQNERGKGIGRKLIEFLIEVGRSEQLSDVFLYTEPEKKAAINLYVSLGFKQRNSDVFNLKLNY